MLLLVLPKREQALPPVEIAVGEQAIAIVVGNEWIEVRQVSRRRAQPIPSIANQKQSQNHDSAAPWRYPLPHRSRTQQREWIQWKNVSFTQVEMSKDRERKIHRRKRRQNPQVRRYLDSLKQCQQQTSNRKHQQYNRPFQQNGDRVIRLPAAGGRSLS